MSVSCYFGLTESGKSYHVKNHVLPQWCRTIVFDIARCFGGDVVLVSPSDQEFLKIFNNLKKKSSFRLVVRPSRSGSDEALFNKTVSLACALGRMAGERIDASERIQFVCDEADFICTPHYQSWALKHLVNKGRHDNVDAHFIARNPNRLHTDIRVNCTKICCFFLNNASSIPFLVDTFTRKTTEKINKLPKFSRIEWRDNGEISAYDKDSKKIEIS